MLQTIKSGTNYDFVGRRKYFAIFSTLLVLASIALFVVVGPTWGIDFTGGTEIRLKFSESMPLADLRQGLEAADFGADAVQAVGDPTENTFVVRIQDATFGSDTGREAVEQALKAKYGADWIAESNLSAEVGSQLTLRYGGEQKPIDEIEQVLTGINGITVISSLDENTFYVKLPGAGTAAEKLLKSALPGKTFEVLQVDSVGPAVGSELRTQGLLALVATMGLLLVYVAFRFDLAFAPGAILAVFHDVTVTVGALIVLDQLGIYTAEFSLSMIGALLTILGFSLNDTIVIYDRIRENERKFRRKDMALLINDSVNETLSRTINTSMTAIISIVPFIIFGEGVMRTFSLAMVIGMIAGVYSTVYVASPMVLVMQDLKPWLTRVLAPKIGKDGEAAPGSAVAATESERRRRERETRASERGHAD